MPSTPAAVKRPHSSPRLRDDDQTTLRLSQKEPQARPGPVEHVQKQGLSTEARSQRKTHPKYSGFQPKSAKPRRSPSQDQLANTLSDQLQANIQDAAKEFSAQIVHTANALANNAADAVGSDVQSAADAINDAVAATSSNIEATIEDTVRKLGSDAEGQVAKYLTPKNVEKAVVGIIRNLAHVAIGAKQFVMSELPNHQDERNGEEDPLLPAKKTTRASKYYARIEHWNEPDPSKKHAIRTTRGKVQHFLSSKVGHYSVLTLVALDVAGIVAAFIISLFKCEKRWGKKGWNEALSALDIASLVFSSLFMLELILSIWAFGPTYFRSKFHIIDALVVIAGFALDLSLHGGAIEEAASLIVVLRLWRVFKIIEELSLGAQEQVEEMKEEIELLRDETLILKAAGLASKKDGEGWRKQRDALRKEKERLEEQLGSEAQRIQNLEASKKDAEGWRKQLDALRKEKERLEEHLESEAQRIQSLEEIFKESSAQSPVVSSSEGSTSKRKGKETDESYNYMWTEAPERETEGDAAEEKVTGRARDYGGEIEGDYGERTDGDEPENKTFENETGEEESEGTEGIFNKVARVFSRADTEVGNRPGARGDVESEVGREDPLTLAGDSGGEVGPEHDDNARSSPEGLTEPSGHWRFFGRLRRGSREWGGSGKSHGSEDSVGSNESGRKT